MDIQTVLLQMKDTAFNARRIGMAYQILNEMMTDTKCTKFLSLSGALIPAGMRSLLSEVISRGIFDVIVTTGATLTHDLIEALGYPHIRLQKSFSDIDLRKKGKSRILDATIEDQAFEKLENWLRSLLAKANDDGSLKGTISPTILLKELGLAISDQISVLSAAAKRNIPIFCPALTDSMLGLHVALLGQEIDLRIDPCVELREILDISFESKRTGALIVGGGVPKNYTLQAMLVSGRSLSYGVQVTMDRPEHGGLSGASLEEAISWGKVDPKAKIVTVVADATIALPLLLGSLLE